MAWAPIILIYEIPCMIGKYFQVNTSIVRIALQAEQTVSMKHRTESHTANKFLHELEEVKEFYSRM